MADRVMEEVARMKARAETQMETLVIQLSTTMHARITDVHRRLDTLRAWLVMLTLLYGVLLAALVALEITALGR